MSLAPSPAHCLVRSPERLSSACGCADHEPEAPTPSPVSPSSTIFASDRADQGLRHQAREPRIRRRTHIIRSVLDDRRRLLHHPPSTKYRLPKKPTTRRPTASFSSTRAGSVSCASCQLVTPRGRVESLVSIGDVRFNIRCDTGSGAALANFVSWHLEDEK